MFLSFARPKALTCLFFLALAAPACSKKPSAAELGQSQGRTQQQTQESEGAPTDERKRGEVKSPAAPSKETHPLKIAAWNVEWLNKSNDAGPVKRTAEDYARLRQYALDLDADLIALSEVHGAEAAARIFDPTLYDFHFSKGRGVQRSGFAYRNNLDVRPHPDMAALAHGGLRAGADVSLHIQGKELRFLAVHLKSGCFSRPLDRGKACKKLARQVPLVEEWIDDRARDNIAFAVLGDFNRTFFKDDADPIWLEWNDGEPRGASLWSPTDRRTSLCWNSKHPHFIDHIVLGESLKRLSREDSFVEHLFPKQQKAFKDVLSDHCALSLEFKLKVRGKGRRLPEVYPLKTVPEAKLAPVQGPIKGNVSRGGKKLYHAPDCPSYAATVIESHKGERLFDSTEQAEAAGFTRAGNCP